MSVFQINNEQFSLSHLIYKIIVHIYMEKNSATKYVENISAENLINKLLIIKILQPVTHESYSSFKTFIVLICYTVLFLFKFSF